jgi:tetratricopeptide (TPR) repeat protein
MIMKRISLYLFFAVLAAGCASSHGPRPGSAISQPVRLGDHSFRVTTHSRQAQEAFNRGLTWAYAFGHHAAEQEFRKAAAADPDCAMAYWGVALVNGPHINFPIVPPDKAEKAWAALEQAKAHADKSTELEQALIAALEKRYASPQPSDRSGLDQAYARAMREIWERFPDNADIGALYAEAEMDLHPWDLWNKDGTAQSWTPLILETLERALVLNPNHPGANHYYIHAIEASQQPEKALASARRLGRLVPDSSHLVHMPSHIYARVGDWKAAAESNRKAMEADRLYRAAYPRPGFYAMYMAHNTHFLAFTAMMSGRSEESIALARQLVKSMPSEFITEYSGVADGFTVFPSKVLMRFGKWKEVLAEPAPRGGLPVATALWHFTRASAFTVMNRMDEARTEAAAFQEAAAKVPDSATFGNNRAADLLAIAKLVLAGEMDAQEGQLDRARTKLGEAVQLEDKLRYDEPPDWIQPVRHTLGAVLLRADQAEEAEKVYAEDLRIWPQNGWALLGLREALLAQGKNVEAKIADAKLKRAWAVADIRPKSTCYCQEVHVTRETVE